MDVPPTHVREALTVLLANLAREQPLVVLLDDMHLADASSWETLDYLARNMIDSRVLVLVCARLGEMVERALGEHVLFGLEQDGVLTRLDLQPLTVPHVRELAERVLGRPSAPSGLAAWLFRESQGNPLFAISLLDAVVDTGVDLAAPRLAAIPPALSARVAERVQALDEHSRSVLDLLAVVGRPTDLVELRRFHSSPAPSSLPIAMARLVDARLAIARDADGDPAYEVSHPLVQECIYAALDPAQRRALHHRVALALTASNRLGEAARHHARSAQRGDVEAVTVLVRALAESWARQTYAEAFVILGSLLDVLPSGDHAGSRCWTPCPRRRLGGVVQPDRVRHRSRRRRVPRDRAGAAGAAARHRRDGRPESAAAAGTCQLLPRRAPRVVPRRGRRRRDQSREGSRPLRARW